ncbi:pentapeptide repeat-containing protein [Nitrosomonas sp. Nm166]|uniref:pentapeptide repeat-containing protein n=1 Tax=Nitrosomonas sp. Nm166 TaxID=1881054 RepID=UPI0008EF27A1|nr:pentapeptide repeat-containing protein [Nitrosomonas sp. Nm166]SFF00968.1 hypothetical protein SAMN05428977_104228 [Nitrosomonas sp. Nm166]
MVLQLIDGRPRIAAADVKKALGEEISEPYILQDHVIEDELNLRFAHISRSIEFTCCEFSEAIDMRNAIFDGTVQFRECIFRGNVNGGDEHLAHTVFKADLNFDGSNFHGFVSFIGFCCEGSATFNHCRFFKTETHESELRELPRPPVEFIGGKVNKAFSVKKSVFKGCVSFNGLHCGLGGFFYKTRFDSCEALAVDFTASSYGVACELTRAVFEGAVVLNGVSCGFNFSVALARFCHPDFLVRFDNSKTDNFDASGAMFAGPVDFSGLRCRNANFSVYSSTLDLPTDEPWLEGNIPPWLKAEMEKQFALLPSSVSFSQEEEDGKWILEFPHSSVRWSLQRDGNNISVSIPTAFLGPSFSLASSDIGLNLYFDNAVVRAEADFSNIFCRGFGLFDRAQFSKTVNFSSSRWEADISLRAAIFGQGANFALCRLRNLYAQGSRYAGKADFTGFSCYYAYFNPYEIPLPNLHLAEGPLSSELRTVLAQHNFHLPESCNLKKNENGKWLILSENDEPHAYIEEFSNQLFLNVLSQFLGEKESLNLDHGQIGWILDLDSAYVKYTATFNALHCTAGSFFRNTQFDGKVDLRYGEFGINLQLDGAQFKSMAEFNNISIKNELILRKAIFYEGANFSGAKIRRLIIDSSNPFRKEKIIFTGCTFDFFNGDWRLLVDRQDPEYFSLDPYLVLERCARAAGCHNEADKIYH